MRILYCITRSNWGGAQQHVYSLAMSQLKINNEVYLVVGESGELTERLKNTSVKVIILKSLQRSIRPLQDIRAVFGLKKIINKINPQILHLHSSKAGVIGRIAAKGNDAKVIFTVHGWAFTEGISRIKRAVYTFIEKKMVRYTDKIICVSKYDLQLAKNCKVISDENESKAIVIYNGTLPSKYEHVRVKFHSIPVLTMVARFDNQKNQELLLNSISRLDSPISLNLIGEGEKLAAMKQYANKLKISNQINFLGFKNNVTDYLNNTDVFILISNYEGLPISIIEAMSVGLPIIASDVGGVSELINNNGVVVKNNTADISKAIQYVLSNPSRLQQMSRNSIELFYKKFLLSQMVMKVNDVYVSLIKDEGF